jgi:hypothetical protein
VGLWLSGCAHPQAPRCTPWIYPLAADSTIELPIDPGTGQSTGPNTGQRTGARTDGQAGGPSGHFLLDTGANVSALEPEWAQAVADVQGEAAVLPGLQLGGVSLAGARFRLETLAASYVGTLGTDILRRFIVTFDYGAGRVELLPIREAPRCAPDRARYEPVPFTLRHGVPLVSLRIGSVALDAPLDTGAWYEFVGIQQPLLEQLTDRLRFVKNVYVVGARGRRLQPTFMGLPVRIGPIELHAPIVQDETNIIGLYVLRRFGRFTIDFLRSTLWVERAAARAPG